MDRRQSSSSLSFRSLRIDLFKLSELACGGLQASETRVMTDRIQVGVASKKSLSKPAAKRRGKQAERRIDVLTMVSTEQRKAPGDLILSGGRGIDRERSFGVPT